MATSGTKWRWIAATALVAAGALAAAWGAGLFDAAPPPPEAAPPPAAPSPSAKAAAPLGAVALALATSKPKAPNIQRRTAEEIQEDSDGAADAGCGAGPPCSENELCVDGGCVSTACGADAGAEQRCALQGGRVGACCAGRCADLEGDGANCGRCGLACPRGLDCLAGQCEAKSCTGQMAGTPCAAGRGTGGCCRGGCADKTTWAGDAANCGGCGHACAPGLACKEGSCVDAATGAQPSWTCLSPEHPCPAGTFCVLDACLPSDCAPESDGLFCPRPGGPPGHCCGGSCTDLFTDSSNCRACGVRCHLGQICNAGECVSPAP